jgi:D-3-phosphoglycerate dehydrogenase
MKKAIVVDKDYGSVTAKDLEELKKVYEEYSIDLELQHFKTEEDIINGCQDVDAILGTGNPPLTENVLHALPNLKLIQRFGIGVNSINLEAATNNNTVVMYMPGFCIEELATHAASFILSLLRNTTYYDRHIRNGEWPKATYFLPKSPSEITLGLYGFGGSARPLHRIFKGGFGTKVIACDPYVSDATKAEYPDVEFVSFEDLCKRSDVVSIHAPLVKETHHIFSTEAFKLMKKDAMIVNIARGQLIDEEALIKALEEGEIRFAGLDVFETEPLSADSPLRHMDNVILTCHSAFYGEGSKRQQLTWAAELVNLALNQKQIFIKHVANRPVIDTNKEFKFI